jgi:hypothetical protein
MIIINVTKLRSQTPEPLPRIETRFVGRPIRVFVTDITEYCVARIQPHFFKEIYYSVEQSPSSEADQFSQLTRKFSAFYGTRRFFAVLTSARHLSLS